jgi:16S rRNA G966 N2-methylase RsmD
MPSIAPFIPTPPDVMAGFFELAPVTGSDVVYDLGCGDGRLLFYALDRGAGRAVGVEMKPEAIKVAREIIENNGFEGRVTILESDMLEVNLQDATVVVCYLTAGALEAIKPKLEKELKPGTRVVTEMYPLPGWKPNDMVRIINPMLNYWVYFYLYVIPPVRE